MLYIFTVNSQFEKDHKLQIYLHKTYFSDARFLDSLHKFLFNQTTLDLRKEKWTFLNREFTVFNKWPFYFIKTLRVHNNMKHSVEEKKRFFLLASETSHEVSKGCYKAFRGFCIQLGKGYVISG